MTTFSTWLINELNKRNWSQSDLVKRVRMAGYKMSSGQLSHIINETRGAGPDACIAIAHALGIPRDEVFKARGWLLKTPERPIQPKTSPEVAEALRGLFGLPEWAQEAMARTIKEQIRGYEEAIARPEPSSNEQRLAMLEDEFKTLFPDEYAVIERRLLSDLSTT